jgi:hypothetical protein
LVFVVFGLIATGSWHRAVTQEPAATPLAAESGADVAQDRANAARTGEIPSPGPGPLMLSLAGAV